MGHGTGCAAAWTWASASPRRASTTSMAFVVDGGFVGGRTARKHAQSNGLWIGHVHHEMRWDLRVLNFEGIIVLSVGGLKQYFFGQAMPGRHLPSHVLDLDLLAVLALLRGHSRPGILFLKWGLVLTLPGALILSFIAYLRIFEGSIQHRFPLLALGVMMVLAGLQLLLAGVMAEWMAAKERGRSSYRIEKSRQESREHQQ